MNQKMHSRAAASRRLRNGRRPRRQRYGLAYPCVRVRLCGTTPLDSALNLSSKGGIASCNGFGHRFGTPCKRPMDRPQPDT
jgi:hypothetical protein